MVNVRDLFTLRTERLFIAADAGDRLAAAARRFKLQLFVCFKRNYCPICLLK